MKFFLAFIIFIFNFQSLTKADDIRDFEIEGISIGDSLLDYFSKNEISKNDLEYYSDNKYITIGFENHPLIKKYDWIEISYKSNDKSFSVVSLNGVLRYDYEYNSCLKKKKQINEELKSLSIKKPVSYNGKHPVDKSGNSNFDNTEFNLSNGLIVTTCIDWSKKMEKQYFDHLKVFLSTNEFWDWITKNPY
ncbi:hypothetical protein OAH52_01600 [Candidatus Pelagibacter sp.]|nr:hypothetical protein [Candidatus Pelagibacter sp.]